MNKNIPRKLKLKLKMLYIIYPLILSFYIILFFISSGIMHYLLLLMVIGSSFLGILSYIGIARELKDSNIKSIEIVHGKKYIYLLALCTILIVLLSFYLYAIFH